MESRPLLITNRLGLHARAAAKVVHVASGFGSEIFIIGADGEKVNAKSILGLLTLAASRGAELKVIADGSDEVAATQALVDLFACKFGEGE